MYYMDLVAQANIFSIFNFIYFWLYLAVLGDYFQLCAWESNKISFVQSTPLAPPP